ncbi:hypothetical protein LFL96_36495 (plasmid) [Paraburkholderia sp. D15]|uniref:hypothetical protein n=1 Tax=Paraburkholderia sp. D15 TaxID=2880218 RepID=UPI00247A949A|nr:hypothetical protein [Paraburkholderia sp. D15]WGS54983.1 hypothetical protein LFL96_36495 [Paraburkholderia sp. D15]
MKLSHRLADPDNAGPAWGLALDVFMAVVGAGLWFYATASEPLDHRDESVAATALLVGLFLADYSARELHHQRRRR